MKARIIGALLVLVVLSVLFVVTQEPNNHGPAAIPVTDVPFQPLKIN